MQALRKVLLDGCWVLEIACHQITRTQGRARAKGRVLGINAIKNGTVAFASNLEPLKTSGATQD